MSKYRVPQKCDNCDLEAKAPIVKRIGSYMVCKYCIENIVVRHIRMKDAEQ